ncbi:MAG TPA: hypothetical protein VJK03_00815 [Candidatus Nanoarchaeia archaeon]|nr:hypothetical protein [Candidatus Nanoarchaeia archaeon]
MDKKELEKLADDPLKVFDYVNKQAWNERPPEVEDFIRYCRGQLESLSRGDQYIFLCRYMSKLHEIAFGSEKTRKFWDTVGKDLEL